MIVITTVARDYHAVLVAAALAELGCDVHVLSQTSLSGRSDLTVGLWHGTPLVRLGEDEIRPSEVRAFWNRRAPKAYNFPDYAHPADRAHIAGSFDAALTGLSVLLDDAFAVNPTSSARCGSNKLNQLRHAPQCGLETPPTIVSNDVSQIRAFSRAVGEICVKPLSVFYWKSPHGVTATMTSVVDAATLDPVAAGLAPAIYQGLVEKAFEVRLVVFGETFIASRIGLAPGGSAAIDWRSDDGYLGRLSPIDPPEQVKSGARKLLLKLGLRFGAFDFVVTPEGRWIFLEVNQAGQFLWQEQFDPQTRLLEPFARYLASAQEDYRWDPTQASDALSFERLSDEATSSTLGISLMDEIHPLDPSSHFDETVAHRATARV